LLVQKKYGEKDTRRCRPCGLPCAARQWRDAKNSLTLRQVWRLIPLPALLLGGTKRGESSVRIAVPGTPYPDEPFFAETFVGLEILFENFVALAEILGSFLIFFTLS
jgi:hypothetical protein